MNEKLIDISKLSRRTVVGHRRWHDESLIVRTVCAGRWEKPQLPRGFLGAHEIVGKSGVTRALDALKIAKIWIYCKERLMIRSGMRGDIVGNDLRALSRLSEIFQTVFYFRSSQSRQNDWKRRIYWDQFRNQDTVHIFSLS